MNLQTMEYIITTAQEKSISRAADTLHITQQTLSAHIANVEQELGCKLFIRHVPLEITYAGEQFLRYAVAIQQQMQGLWRTFSEISGEERGLLKIGVTDNRDRIILLPIVLRFQQEHPKIELKVIEAPNEELIDKLLKGEIDVCLSDFSTRRSGFQQVDLYEERVVFVIHKSLFHQIYGNRAALVRHQIEDQAQYQLLQDCPLLVGHEGDIAGRFSRRVMESFEKAPFVRVEAENMAFVLALCAKKLGGCFCPEVIVRHTLTAAELENMEIITLGEASTYTIRLGWKGHWNIIDAFVNTARKGIETEHDTMKNHAGSTEHS